MGKNSIDIELKGVEKAIRKLKFYETEKIGSVKKIVAETGHRIEAQAKVLAPVKHGNLKTSIHTETENKGLAALIGTGVNYAPHVEYGTRPHIIRVKKAGALSDGKKIFGKVVKHPGTRAQPFLTPAYNRNKQRFINEIKRVMKESEEI